MPAGGSSNGRTPGSWVEDLPPVGAWSDSALSLGLTGWGIRRGAPAESATMTLHASLLVVLGGLAYAVRESRLFPHTGHTPDYEWGVELD